MNQDERDRIRRDAEQFAHSFFDRCAEGHPDELTTEWLMKKHPNLTPEEAEEYRLFCKSHTITFKACYGNGSIMWPKWVAFREEIAEL